MLGGELVTVFGSYGVQGSFCIYGRYNILWKLKSGAGEVDCRTAERTDFGVWAGGSVGSPTE